MIDAWETPMMKILPLWCPWISMTVSDKMRADYNKTPMKIINHVIDGDDVSDDDPDCTFPPRVDIVRVVEGRERERDKREV